MLYRSLLALPIACAALVAGESDGGIAGLMRRADPRVRHVKVLTRTQVDPTLDLVVALGREYPAWPREEANGWWGSKTRLGLFLQRREQPGIIFQLAMALGRDLGECMARVERVTASQVVVSCAAEKGNDVSHWKFFYDLRAKALVGQIDYDQLPLSRVSVSGERTRLSATGPKYVLTVEFDPERTDRSRVRMGATASPPIPERRIVRFGPGSRFALGIDPNGTVVESPFPLSQSTYDEFATARPRKVKDVYVRAHIQIAEAIGPWQLAEGTLWFAKSFYDEEGYAGVGGFGYVDTVERRYRIYAPPELVNWSASAILVEPDAVWIGLVQNGEWGSTSGGLLRFDRRTEKAELIPMRDIVAGIARLGDRLVMATSFGLAVLEGGSIRRYFVDRTSTGMPVVAEAVIDTYSNSRR